MSGAQSKSSTTHFKRDVKEIPSNGRACNRAQRCGFTFVELLITLSLLAILFIPMMQSFSSAMEATNASRDLITAVSLARWEMERVRNLGVSTERLKRSGNTMWPPAEEPPLELNGRAWRISRVVTVESEPLEVAVEVRRDGEAQALTKLVVLLTDTFWGQAP